MYDLETVKETLKEKLLTLTDPYITGSTTPILTNVTRGEPDKIGLFNGTLGVLLFADMSEKPMGISKGYNSGSRRQLWQGTIDGVVILFVPGNNDGADTVATHLSDIVSDFFKVQNAINLPGVLVSPLVKGKSMNWRPISISLENMSKPMECLTAAVKFTITINDNLKHTL